MMFQLALVTGATSGLGRELCMQLSRQGIPLLLSGRRLDALKELQTALAVPCHLHHGDLSHAPAREELIRMIHQLCPDLIINNAGFGLYGEALMHSTEDQLSMIDLNINALTEISLEAARTLISKKQPGTILNVSSAAGYFVYPSFAIYAASKEYVSSFSQALDEELSKYHVRVLVSCPGQINTAFRIRASGGFHQKKNLWTLAPEKAARLILEQIEKGTRKQVIDWRYRLFVCIAKWLLPEKLVRCILVRSVESRHGLKEILLPKDMD